MEQNYQPGQNILGVLNPDGSLPPSAVLNRALKQNQIHNIAAQQKAMQATEGQLSALREKQKAPDLTKWAMVGDMLNPGHNLTNIAQAIKPENTAKQEYNLARQLQAQRSGVIGASQDLIQADRQAGLNAERMAFQKKMMQDQYANAKDLASFKAGLKNKQDLTPGQKKADQDFGKDYQQWVSGGFASTQENLGLLDNVIKDIEDKKTTLGRRVMPEFLRALYAPESVVVQQNIGSIVYQSLKEILGGQFTQKEGERLVAQSYDPSLPDEENAKKARAMKEKFLKMAAAKQKAVEYFKKKGSLKGFEGSSANTLEDYLKEQKKEIFGGGDDAADLKRKKRIEALRKKYLKKKTGT